MENLVSFTIVSVDGFFAGPQGEIDWFRNDNDEEDREFSRNVSTSPGTLVMGRTTYELMSGFWPTPFAIQSDPIMAATMNKSKKLVFSTTMKPVRDGPVWKNVTVVPEINREKILEMKEQSPLAILGSGSLVQQFANLGLIDEFQLMVNPIVLGSGRQLFAGVNRINLKLLESKPFKNGKLFLRYGVA